MGPDLSPFLYQPCRHRPDAGSLAVIRWLARYPLAIALAIQAAVQLPALGLLYPWMDEATTLFEARDSSSRILAMIGGDVHPPLYFLLVSGWQKIPFGFSEEAQA